MCLSLFIAGIALARGLASESPEEFSATLAEKFSEAAPAARTVVAHPLVLSVKTGGGGVDTIPLQTLYKTCQDAPESCARKVARFVKQVAGSLGSIDLADRNPQASALRVVVRPAAMVRPFINCGCNAKDHPIARVIAGDAWLVLYADAPNIMTSVSSANLGKLGLTEDQALVIGLENTERVLPPLNPSIEGKDPHAIHVMKGDSYASSRFLLHDSWRPLADRFGGKLIVAVAERESVLYTQDGGPEDEAALKRVARATAATASNPLLTTVFRWTKAGWDPLP